MATTTQAATQNPVKAGLNVKTSATSAPPPETPQKQSLTLGEALLALEHLTKRGLLCSKCGYGWAEWDNQVHSLCNDCKVMFPNMNFNPKMSGKGSDFERILGKRFQEWVGTFIQGNGSSTGDTSNSGGNR